jgi:hypothetical protein
MRRTLCLLGLLVLLVPSVAGATAHRIAAITISPATVPAGTTGTAYSQALSGVGGTGPYTFAITAGTLPPGVTLSSAGLLSGTPTSAGSYSFTVTATDSLSASGSQAYTLSISPATVTLTPATLPTAVRGDDYSVQIDAAGGTAPYSFSVTNGALPAGLWLDSDGFLDGAPGATGTYTFTVTAVDANGASGSRTYTLTVDVGTMDISPVSLANANAGKTFSDVLTGIGGIGPYTFTVSSGNLTPGLVLAPNGVLSGVPSHVGTYSFTVKMTDSTGVSTSRTYAHTVVVNALTIAPAAVPGGTYGKAYSTSFTASGGTTPYTFVLTGSLPNGLTLNAAGELKGTPTQSGAYSFSVTATDPYGSRGTYPYTLVVASPTLVVSPDDLFAATSGVFYSQSLTTAGGLGTYTYTLSSGGLPAGLTLAAGGTLSGTPNDVPGLYTFTVRTTDAYGSTGTKTYTLQMATPTIYVTSAALPSATVGTQYLQSIAVAGGSAPYSFALVDGVPPSGITLSPVGILSGTPTTEGTYLFTVHITDARGVTATQSFRLVVVKPAPTVTKTKPVAKKKKKRKSTRR